MAKKITKLTAEQEANLPAIREEWLAKGLATGPCDRTAVEASARKLYEAAGLAFPQITIWMSSPFGGCLAAGLIDSESLRDQVGAQVGAQVGDQVRAQVWDQVRAQVWDQVRDQVWDQVGDQVGDQVWAQVGDQVGDQVWAQVGAQVGDQARAMLSWDRIAYGQHDASWVGGWAETFRRFGIELSDAHNAWLDAMLGMLECGWWWPMRGAVVFTDRPDELHRDAQGRLHNERGMAISYSDGWGIWSIHGVRVTEQIVERPHELTIAQILGESNAEIRRVMCERYGWDRFTTDADLTLIDECPDPANEPNTIRLYDLPDHFQVFGTRVRLITVTNATPERDGTIRRFGLTVPYEKTKALDAAAWTGGMDAKTYKQLARAT